VTTTAAPSSTKRQLRTAMFAVIGICFMTGVAWASIPLYRMFCQVTGLNGTTQRAEEAPGAVNKLIRIDFDSNVAPGMKWRFRPEAGSETVKIGARTGTATFNVTPSSAGKYFTKIQCFCFTQQTLKPGETQRMPVIFFVDPKIMDDPDAKDVETITLSYTFYPVDSAKTTG
jgi:cytochrome c oxidase assembly protein subunit 11